MWDIQQQRVIDMIFEAEIDVYKSFEDASLPFTFAGYMLDITRLDGDFCCWNSSSNQQATLAYWTGLDFCLIHDGITHEYSQHTLKVWWHLLRDEMSA